MLKIKRHQQENILSRAVYSRCGSYRYYLDRRWSAGAVQLFVMLNPSNATELKNDQTLARCQRRAMSSGFGAFAVVNLFAWRSPDPEMLKAVQDPIGPLNDRILSFAARVPGQVICGWGNHGDLDGRDAEVLALMHRSGRPLYHLGLTFRRQPRHPLYVAGAVKPELWDV